MEKEKKQKETIGKISSDLLQKEPETRDPIEIQREAHKDYCKHLEECIYKHKKFFMNDFYVVVITKQERLMHNVIRNFFAARLSCPTPTYDQTVYKFNYKDNSIEFLWVVPSKDTCEYLASNALIVDNDERVLLGFVIDFYNNTLLNKAKKLNGEDTISKGIM